MSDPLRVLIVGDSGADAALVVQALDLSGADLDWTRVETPGQLHDALTGRAWDVVVAAGGRQWPTNPTALEMVRQSGLDLPFIVVCGAVGETAAAELMRAGAHDVLTHDTLNRLPDAIRRERHEARLRADRRRREEARDRADLALRAVLRGTTVVGEEFFRALVRELALVLGADRVLVGELAPGPDERVRTVAVWADGALAADFGYPLRGSPCAGVVGRDLRYFPSGVAGAFPDDPILAVWGIESYLGMPLFRSDGTPAGLLVVMHSRTLDSPELAESLIRIFAARVESELERVRAAEALRRSEDELRSIFSAVPTGIAVYLGRAAQAVNDRMCEMTGYSHAELEGTVTRFLYEADEEFERVGREAHRQIAETGRASVETRWVRKDHRIIDVLVSWAPIDAADFARGVTVAVLDVTDRRSADDRLRRLAAAIEQSEEGVMITDPEGFIEYVNPAFERITGYLADEALHQPSRMLNSGKQGPAFYERMWSTIQAGHTWVGRFVNRRKDGTLYHQDCTISPVFGSEGRIERFVAAMRDVTKSLQLEEDLRQSQRVESLGRLAAVVAHDFNNLLSPILGYAELLLSELHPSDERYGQIQEIETASRRARDLTRQLLAFGRKQALQIRPVDLNAVAGGIERLLRRALREDVTLTIVQHPSPCVVMADQGQAEQVVMNLAVNAQDAMPGGGRITIRTDALALNDADCAKRPGTSPGRYGVIVVSDTGCGMDADTKRRIFEPFFSTKGDRGTGLGLSTVYGIVKQHGGHVVVESEVGQGSVFEIYLPSTDAEPATDVRPLRPAVRRQSSETILLVEDDDAVRALTETVLRREGYTVLAAAGGDEAVALLDQHPGGVHLLLTDVIMSGMDGRTLHRIVTERCASAKVLFMSGHTDDVVADRGVLEASVPFVQKPFSVVALAQKVRDVLES